MQFLHCKTLTEQHKQFDRASITAGAAIFWFGYFIIDAANSSVANTLYDMGITTLAVVAAAIFYHKAKKEPQIVVIPNENVEDKKVTIMGANQPLNYKSFLSSVLNNYQMLIPGAILLSLMNMALYYSPSLSKQTENQLFEYLGTTLGTAVLAPLIAKFTCSNAITFFSTEVPADQLKGDDPKLILSGELSTLLPGVTIVVDEKTESLLRV